MWKTPIRTTTTSVSTVGTCTVVNPCWSAREPQYSCRPLHDCSVLAWDWMSIPLALTLPKWCKRLFPRGRQSLPFYRLESQTALSCLMNHAESLTCSVVTWFLRIRFCGPSFLSSDESTPLNLPVCMCPIQCPTFLFLIGDSEDEGLKPSLRIISML